MVTGAEASDKAGEAAKRQWRLRVLGGFSLTDHEGVEASGLGKLDRALLTYLVLSGQQRHVRAKLAGLLWPDRSEALRSLVVSLHTLRRALGDKSGEILAMNSDPMICRFETIEVDALVLERLVKLRTPEALEKAEALYAGELLLGLDVRSDEFNHWLIQERTRLQGIIIDGLRPLMRHREQSNHLERAIETARRILQIDNFIEEAHRTMIVALLRTGQRAAARKHAEYCEHRLKEAGIDPEPETSRLILLTRRGGNTGEDRSQQTPSAALARRPAESAAAPAPANGSVDKNSWNRSEGPLGVAPYPAVSPEPDTSTTEQAQASDRQTPDRMPAGSVVQPIRLAFVMSAALLVAVLAVTAALFWHDPGPPPPVKEEKPSVAILPFESHGDSDAAEYAESVSGDVGVVLSYVSEITSVPRTSVLALSDKRLPPTEIAKALRVRYLLEGQLEKVTAHVEVAIRLIDTRNADRAVLTEMFDADGSDVTKLKKQIVKKVITELKVLLTDGEQERIDIEHGTRNVEVWLATSRGERLIRQLDPAAIRKAREEYELAASLDAGYAGAWEGVAWTYYIECRFGWGADPGGALDKAAKFGQKARELDPKRARTYSLLGSVRLLQRDFQEAIHLGQEAVALEPNDADSAALLAHTYTYVGRQQDAIDSIRRAIDLRRVAPRWYSWVLGRALRLAGDYRQAAAVLEDAIGASPDSYVPLVELTATLQQMGDSAEARARATQIGMLTFVMGKQFSSSGWVNLVPYEDPAAAARDIAALRNAGLPD